MVPRLNKSVHINPTFSWVDWDLYEGVNGTEAVAFRLNQRLAELVNRGEPQDRVVREMYKLMEQNAVNGAFDTEPRILLQRVLEEVFGDNNG